MDRKTPNANPDLVEKIARLIEERGWNQKDFARISNLNLQTVRQILQPTGLRKLRNATVSACATALGLTVNELRHWPLERLLPRMRGLPPVEVFPPTLHRRFEQATQPELVAWMNRNPDRANKLSPEEMDELVSLQGTGGPLTSLGVEHYVKQIERRRRLIEMVHDIAGTEYFDLLQQIVALLHEKVQPYRDRKISE